MKNSDPFEKILNAMNKKEMKNMVEDLKKEKKNLLDKLKTEKDSKQNEQPAKSVSKKSLSIKKSYVQDEINEETEIKFEMEREKQAQLLKRQKMLNEKLMRAKGKQATLAKKLYKYKQVLIAEGYSHMVESAKINRIQINEEGEVFQFGEKYERFNEGPTYSSKFVKRNAHEEVVEERRQEKGERGEKGREKEKVVRRPKKRADKKGQKGYLEQFSSKMLGETGNQKKSTLRNTTKSEKNFRPKPKKKVNQSHLAPSSKYTKRRKSTASRQQKKMLKKVHSTKSHKAYVSGKKEKKGERRGSGFQKIDKLQARRLERRQKSQRGSKQ